MVTGGDAVERLEKRAVEAEETISLLKSQLLFLQKTAGTGSLDISKSQGKRKIFVIVGPAITRAASKCRISQSRLRHSKIEQFSTDSRIDIIDCLLCNKLIFGSIHKALAKG